MQVIGLEKIRRVILSDYLLYLYILIQSSLILSVCLSVIQKGKKQKNKIVNNAGVQMYGRVLISTGFRLQ